MGVVGNMQSSNLLDTRTFLTDSFDKTTANVLGAAVSSTATPTTTSSTQTSTAIIGLSTANRTYEAFKEMRYGNSMPCHFVLGLNLDKSPGQLSGFNTSATNVDIELRFELDQQNLLANMPQTPIRAAAGVAGPSTWAANQGTHLFQPSKFKVHDTTSTGTAYKVSGPAQSHANVAFYALDSTGVFGGQPDNMVFNGEGFAMPFYTASELCLPTFSAAAGTGAAILTTAIFAATQTGATAGGTTTLIGPSAYRAQNRFPDSGQTSLDYSTVTPATYPSGYGLVNGGITSTCFMYTKPASNAVLITFYAYIDAQVSIMKVGQLEVLR